MWWRLAIAAVAIFGVGPRVGLYAHHHAYGEDVHVHVADAERSRRAPLDIAALWLAVRDPAGAGAPRQYHHGHGHDRHSAHDHAPDHDHGDRVDAIPASHPVQHGTAPTRDDLPGFARELPHAAGHWHAGGPLHHLAVPLHIGLPVAGTAHPLPRTWPGRQHTGVPLPAHARGPPTATAGTSAAL